MIVQFIQGAGANKIIPNVPDLGVAANIVVRLSQKVTDFSNHIIYFDNFYTTLPLLIYLRSRGIFSLGTIRTNRIPQIKLSSDMELKQKNRGYNEEYVGVSYGCDISCVLWNDTKPVRLVSTYVGIQPFYDTVDNRHKPELIERWDKKSKTNVSIECPKIISEYNKHMGGVDLMDGLIGRYHIEMKTRKWTNRLFHHLIDVSMVNAYILYRRVIIDDRLDLPSFRSSVAEALCFFASGAKRRVGRPVKNDAPKPIPKKTTKTKIPIDDIRFDGFNHMCIFLDRNGKLKCKYEGCKAQTQSYCEKCKLNLCNSPQKDCFVKFHTP